MKAYHWATIQSMKEFKINKWNNDLEQVRKDRRAGRLSPAQSYLKSMILVRDIRIFQGLEKCCY